MSMHDAEVSDVYADKEGKLWRVVGICGEPTVILQEIESIAPDCAAPVQMRGGISEFVWSGFKRIYRHGERR